MNFIRNHSKIIISIAAAVIVLSALVCIIVFTPYGRFYDVQKLYNEDVLTFDDIFVEAANNRGKLPAGIERKIKSDFKKYMANEYRKMGEDYTVIESDVEIYYGKCKGYYIVKCHCYLEEVFGVGSTSYNETWVRIASHTLGHYDPYFSRILAWKEL